MFQTKLQQAADLVLRAVETLQQAGKDVWVVADGASTKRQFVRPAMELGVTLADRRDSQDSLPSTVRRETLTTRVRRSFQQVRCG